MAVQIELRLRIHGNEVWFNIWLDGHSIVDDLPQLQLVLLEDW